MAGLLGYVPRLRLLGSIRPGYFPMAPLVALSFLVLAAVLYGHVRSRDHTVAVPTGSRALWAPAGLVVLFAVLEIAGDITGLDLTLESRLTAGLGSLNGIPIGQTSAATAVGFVLVGVGTLLLVPGPWGRQPARQPARRLAFWASNLGALAVLLALTVLLGYAYGTPFMYGGGAVPMAATTALAFVFLGGALAAAAGPEDFFLRLAIGDATSARLSRVFIPLVVVVAFLESALTGVSSPAGALVRAASLVVIVALTATVVARFARTFGHALDERQRSLAASEQRLRAILHTAMDGFWRIDAQGRLLEVNEAYCRMSGYDAAELLTMRIADLEAAKSAEEVAALGRILGAQGGGRFESRHRRRDGSTYDVAISVQRQSADGAEIVVFLQDISERKRADLERQVMYDIAQGVATSADLDQLLMLLHHSLQRVFPAENCFAALHDPATGLFSFPYFADEHDAAPAPTALSNSCTAYVFRRGQPLLGTPALFGRLHEQREIELVGTPSLSWMGVPLRTPSGVIGVLVVQDYEREDVYSERDLEFLASVGSQFAVVIERTLADATLREREAELNVILESTADGLLAVDREGRVLKANRRFAELWRLPQSLIDARNDEALLQHVLDQLTDPDAFLAQVRALYGTADRSMDTLHFKDGRQFERYSAPLLMDDAVAGRVWSFRDITERATAEAEQGRLEEALRQAQRMESVGRLAGGIAHDFNNMLAVILGNAELAMVLDERKLPLGDHLSEIHRAATRSAELTRQLLGYARKQRIVPHVLDLNAAVTQALQMLRRLIGEDIALSWQPGDDLWQVSLDPAQLDQVLANLFVNARAAIADVGQIVIATSNRLLDASFCASHAGAVPGEYVLLSVGDSGHGMTPEVMDRIFEPFFTTKGVGEGSGLGLAMVYGAVKQNNGFIAVESAPGRGTTFDIYLPRHVGAARPPGPAEPDVARGRGNETILLVEDEAAVLQVTTRILEAQGYTVLSARGPRQAIQLASGRQHRLHLLLTDMVMPEMNGRDLASALRATHPALQYLLMSGYTRDSGDEGDGVVDEAHFIGKPFAAAALCAKVREVLDRA